MQSQNKKFILNKHWIMHCDVISCVFKNQTYYYYIYWIMYDISLDEEFYWHSLFNIHSFIKWNSIGSHTLKMNYT